MNHTVKVLGERCIALDDRVVGDHHDEKLLRELRTTAQALRKHPGYRYFSLYYVGRAAFFQRRHKKSLFFFNAANRAVETSSALDVDGKSLNHDLCLIGAAIAYFNLERRAEARTCLDQVLNTEHPRVGGRLYGEFGWNSLRDQAYEAAEQAFRASLKFDKLNKYTLNGLGNALYEQKKYAHAKAVLETGLKLDPHYSHNWCDLGYVSLAMNQVEEAEQQFSRALAVNQTPRSIRGLGESYIRSGRRQEGKLLVDYANYLDGKGTNEGFAAAMELLSEVIPTK